jgi:hypothetical protein
MALRPGYVVLCGQRRRSGCFAFELRNPVYRLGDRNGAVVVVDSGAAGDLDVVRLAAVR